MKDIYSLLAADTSIPPSAYITAPNGAIAVHPSHAVALATAMQPYPGARRWLEQGLRMSKVFLNKTDAVHVIHKGASVATAQFADRWVRTHAGPFPVSIAGDKQGTMESDNTTTVAASVSGRGYANMNGGSVTWLLSGAVMTVVGPKSRSFMGLSYGERFQLLFDVGSIGVSYVTPAYDPAWTIPGVINVPSWAPNVKTSTGVVPAALSGYILVRGPTVLSRAEIYPNGFSYECVTNEDLIGFLSRALVANPDGNEKAKLQRQIDNLTAHIDHTIVRVKYPAGFNPFEYFDQTRNMASTIIESDAPLDTTTMSALREKFAVAGSFISGCSNSSFVVPAATSTEPFSVSYSATDGLFRVSGDGNTYTISEIYDACVKHRMSGREMIQYVLPSDLAPYTLMPVGPINVKVLLDAAFNAVVPTLSGAAGGVGSEGDNEGIATAAIASVVKPLSANTVQLIEFLLSNAPIDLLK